MRDISKLSKNRSPTVVYPQGINPAIANQKVVDRTLDSFFMRGNPANELSRKIVISHHFEPDNQIEVGATNHHWLCYLLSDYNSCQITRIGDREYTVDMKRGEIWLKPNFHNGFWSWSNSDECLMFAIAPDWLRQIAAENEFSNANSVEILPVLNQHDPQLQKLATLFLQEMNSSELGDRMYIESLSNMLAINTSIKTLLYL